MSNRLLESIEPKEVFRYFEDLTRIPRCSGKEENVVAYLISFAEQHGFDWWKDEKLNIVIKNLPQKDTNQDQPSYCKLIQIWCAKRIKRLCTILTPTR